MSKENIYVTNIKFKLNSQQIGTVKDNVNISLFNSMVDDIVSPDFEPIIGKIVGTNYWCYGVRIHPSQLIFKIFCADTNQVYLCTVVDEIVVLCMIYNCSYIKNAKCEYLLVDNVKEKLNEIDIDHLFAELKTLPDDNNTVQNSLIKDITNSEMTFANLFASGHIIRHNILCEIIANYLEKYCIEDISHLTDDKKLIRLYNKQNLTKFYKTLDGLSPNELMQFYLNVKKDLPNQQVFEEFGESVLDLLQYYSPELFY